MSVHLTGTHIGSCIHDVQSVHCPPHFSLKASQYLLCNVHLSNTVNNIIDTAMLSTMSQHSLTLHSFTLTLCIVAWWKSMRKFNYSHYWIPFRVHHQWLLSNYVLVRWAHETFFMINRYNIIPWLGQVLVIICHMFW